MTTNEPKNSVDNAFPSASNPSGNPSENHSGDPNSMDQDLVSINAKKAQLEWVQISLEGEFDTANVSNATEAIQKHCFSTLKINVAKILVDKSKKCLSVCFESKEAADLFFQSDFQSILSSGASLKKTTSNPELDSRRIRLSILASGRIDPKFTKAALARFGEVEDFYESSAPNSVKRSFTVAFKHIYAKESLEKFKFVTIGNVVYKVENFNPEIDLNLPRTKPILLKLHGINVKNSDLSVKPLMSEMGAIYWHFVRSKRGIKMPILMVEFASEADKKKAEAIIWNFQGERIFLSQPDKKCCYICGSEHHLSPECPKKKPQISRITQRSPGLSAKKSNSRGVEKSLGRIFESCRCKEKSSRNRQTEF
jgi:hypothetical protein